MHVSLSPYLAGHAVSQQFGVAHIDSYPKSCHFLESEAASATIISENHNGQ